MLWHMDISLAPEIQGYLEEQVRAGRYASISEAVNELLWAAQREEQLTEADIAELRSDIALGLSDIENGRVGEWDPNDLKRRVHEH